jgi:hypothetical protein
MRSCRAVQYQRRLINDGAEAYRHRCATKIQVSEGAALRTRVPASQATVAPASLLSLQ